MDALESGFVERIELETVEEDVTWHYPTVDTLIRALEQVREKYGNIKVIGPVTTHTDEMSVIDIIEGMDGEMRANLEYEAQDSNQERSSHGKGTSHCIE